MLILVGMSHWAFDEIATLFSPWRIAHLLVFGRLLFSSSRRAIARISDGDHQSLFWYHSNSIPLWNANKTSILQQDQWKRRTLLASPQSVGSSNQARLIKQKPNCVLLAASALIKRPIREQFSRRFVDSYCSTIPADHVAAEHVLNVFGMLAESTGYSSPDVKYNTVLAISPLANLTNDSFWSIASSIVFRTSFGYKTRAINLSTSDETHYDRYRFWNFSFSRRLITRRIFWSPTVCFINRSNRTKTQSGNQDSSCFVTRCAR